LIIHDDSAALTTHLVAHAVQPAVSTIGSAGAIHPFLSCSRTEANKSSTVRSFRVSGAMVLAATVFAHESAAFSVHVLAGAGVDVRLSCRVGSGCAEEAGERGDGFEEQGVSAGLLVGGAAGTELGDGAAVFGLGGKLADPGGHGGVLEGGRAAGCGAASRG